MHLKKAVFILLVCLLAGVRPAMAVCLDPHTGISGYKIPLDEEIDSTQRIIMGQVTGKPQILQEDPSDPIGVTAYLYTVHVLRQLKGTTPENITIRSENTSARFPMDVGEKYLLFLSKDHDFWVNSCGNSAPLEESGDALYRIKQKIDPAAEKSQDI